MFHGLKKKLALPLTLFHEFKNGSEDAFEKLFSRFRKPILSYVQARVANEETAQELTQEIFLKVYRFRDHYEDRYAFSTWLWTIARNTIADHLRGAKSSLHGMNSAVMSDDVVLDELPSRERHAEELLENKDTRRGLLKIMRSLTRMQKRVLWMRVVHHLSYQEIAENLQLSLSAVKNLALRGKTAMTESLELAGLSHPAMGLA
jgi:RNA polymerase sigma-70 factor (ECF subfamily)